MTTTMLRRVLSQKALRQAFSLLTVDASDRRPVVASAAACGHRAKRPSPFSTDRRRASGTDAATGGKAAGPPHPTWQQQQRHQQAPPGHDAHPRSTPPTLAPNELHPRTSPPTQAGHESHPSLTSQTRAGNNRGAQSATEVSPATSSISPDPPHPPEVNPPASVLLLPRQEQESNKSSVGLYRRFRNVFRQYGKVASAVHVATSCVWYGAFYYAAVRGVNPVPLLELLGVPDAVVGLLRGSSAHLLTAYTLYHISTPLRWFLTLGATPLTVSYLRRWGLMATPPTVFQGERSGKTEEEEEERTGGMFSDRTTKERLSKKMEETRDKLSEKMEETKDKLSEKMEETRGKLLNKMEESRDKLTEKMELTRDKLTEKMEETREKLTEKMEETKEKLSDKLQGIEDHDDLVSGGKSFFRKETD